MFGKYNGFVSKARVSACMYFLVRYKRSGYSAAYSYRGVNYSEKSVRRFLGFENPCNFSRDSWIFSPNIFLNNNLVICSKYFIQFLEISWDSGI